MRPVNQAAEVIPLVHAPELDTVSQPNRHALRNVNIVCDEERLPIADIENKTLMPRTLTIVRQ